MFGSRPRRPGASFFTAFFVFVVAWAATGNAAHRSLLAQQAGPTSLNASSSGARRATQFPANPVLYDDIFQDRPKECPPCFNCQLPAFNCANSGQCRNYDGQCDCPIGFGGQDCLSPLCGSPVKGKERYPREGDECLCDQGWGGLNCNVCQSSFACSNILLGDERLGDNGNCYNGGSTVRQSFQQCDVTNKQIRELLPGRPPKVTFSCQRKSETCNFQVSRLGPSVL